MGTLTTIVAFLSLALNIVFFLLLKYSNIMRGPRGEQGFTGPMGMTGRCECEDKR